MTTSRSFASGLAFMLATLGASASHATPRQPTHVACVGDSITAGAGASSESNYYPSLLQGLYGGGVQVQNFGNSGSTMLSAGYGDKPYWDQVEFDGATSFVSSAGAEAVVSVVIILGANDSKPFNWSPGGLPKNDQQYLTDYRAMVDHFLSLTPKPVVYVGLPLATTAAPCCDIDGTVIHDEQIPLIQQLAMEMHLPLIDLNTPTTGHDEYFVDGVHPNDAGYAVMAQAVYDGLQREPTIALTSPAANAMLPNPLTLTAEASGGTVLIESVEFFEGAESVGLVTEPPFSMLRSAAAGMHQITATAVDSTGASATTEPVTVTLLDEAGGSSAGGNSGGGGSGGVPASGGSGTAGAPGTGGSGGSGGVPGTAGTGGAAGSAPAAGGTGAAPTSAPESSGGCGCRAIGRPDRVPGFGVVLALSALALGRRRRSSAMLPPCSG